LPYLGQAENFFNLFSSFHLFDILYNIDDHEIIMHRSNIFGTAYYPLHSVDGSFCLDYASEGHTRDCRGVGSMKQQIPKPIRVYLNSNQEGVVICPHCSFGKTINMSNYQGYFGGKSLKVRCKRCKTSFHVEFDYRQHPRIKVNISGKLPLNDLNIGQDIIVTSLSVSGVGFVIIDMPKINIDNILDIQFHLGDNNSSFIQEKITVRRINGDFVGAEYCADAYRHELDFYVMHALGIHVSV